MPHITRFGAMIGYNTKDVFSLIGFLWLWIIPAAYYGVDPERPLPGMPRLLIHLRATSCLFPVKADSFVTHYIQVQIGSGSPWLTLEEKDYFPLKVYGHQSRFQRLFKFAVGKHAGPLCENLARWVRKRYHEFHPGRPMPTAVRILAGGYRTGSRFQGPWKTPPLESYPPQDVSVIAEYSFHPDGHPVSDPP